MIRLKRNSLPAVALLLVLLIAETPITYSQDWSSPDMRITWEAQADVMPSFANASAGKIWLFWCSSRDGNYEVYYKIYDPSKVHRWSSETRLTNNPHRDETPSATMTNDGKIWVTWASNRTGNYEIFYKTYDGSSWSSDTQLTNNASRDEFPSIMQTKSGTIWVVWDSSRLGAGYEIFYKTTSNNGENWSPDTRIQFSKAGNWDPSIVQARDDKMWLVWTRSELKGSNVYDDIFYSTSTNNGVSWQPEQALTSAGEEMHPSIMQATDNRIWVVWDSERLLQTDVYYRIYSGTSWLSETRLTTNAADDMGPTIAQDIGGVIMIGWGSYRNLNYDLYYRPSSPPSAHDMETFSVIPLNTTVVKAESISVEVVGRNKGQYDESNVAVKLYINGSLLETKIVDVSAGELYPMQFIWPTNGLSYANYELNATITPVSGETTTADNFVVGIVKLTWAPVASFVYSPLYPMPNELITFDASASTPDGGTIVSYRWDFGDGNITEVANPVITHHYTAYNIYSVTLTITDSDGPTATRSRLVSVHRHDVALLWGDAYWSQSPQGLLVPYDVDVTNYGSIRERFAVSLFFGETVVGTTQVDLFPGETWYYVELEGDSSLVSPGTYSVTAVAGPLAGETNRTDNYWYFPSIWIYDLDFAVTGLSPSVTKAYVGRTVEVTVTVANIGSVDAHGNLMLYHNSTLIESRAIFLAAETQEDFVFSWETSTVNPGYYTLKARVQETEASLIELDLEDNEKTFNGVQVKIPGDINGDKTVSSVDLSILKSVYGLSEGHPDWDAECDINGDGVVDVYDLMVLGKNYGKSNP